MSAGMEILRRLWTASYESLRHTEQINKRRSHRYMDNAQENEILQLKTSHEIKPLDLRN
jgi:hypothetical protein